MPQSAAGTAPARSCWWSTAPQPITSIQAALERNAEVEARHIKVTVSGGKVTLAGRVNAWTEREAAERAAWSVPGVTAVDDEIELGRP